MREYSPDADYFRASQPKPGAAEITDVSTVMIVDDSPVVRKILEISLQRVGISSISFCDSNQVLRWLKTEIDRVVAVAILDLHLPGMDGYALARLLRSEPRFDETALIFLTGYDNLLSRLRVRRLKKTCYLLKPFKTQDIIDAVSTYVPLPLHNEEMEAVKRTH